ncbi:MAG: energy transducer TonB [Methylomonas sp.]|nr:energy transducer TonB [Methylomonas sp.]
MTTASGTARPNRKVLVPSLALLAAVTVNVGLLLLIGALISDRRIELAQQPQLQPIDFVRVRPKPRPIETKSPVEAAAIQQAPAQPRPTVTKQIPAPRKPRQAKTEKRVAPQKELFGVAAPRLDIPALGDGAAFPSAPGSDARLTGPPAQWNPDKQPAPAESGETEGGAGGSSKSKLVALSRTLPDYPPKARDRGIQGWVVLEISVTPSGKVGSAQVVAADPKGVFDEAALEAVKQWRFQPAYKDGQAVEQRARQMVKFTLKQQ